ncbi:MAG: hypothetical protein PHE77_03445, partial [Candidatus Pacebacteria bacterium]|nr:hypothetical protein [Candidatus Paceibacterota bacterium]
SSLIAIVFVLFGGYAFIEPSDVDATSTSTLVVASLFVSEEITLSAPAAFSLSPNMSMSNSSSSATGTWNVKTNSQAGYTLSLHASQEDALVATTTGEVFQDCPTSTPDFWNQGCATSTGYVFGFSAYGNAVPTATWGTGGDCGSSGNPSETLEYRGFNSTNDIEIASANSETSPSGTDSTMCLTATQGSSVYAPDGLYQATITATATTQ